jgi:hypothetical protein
MCTQNHKKKDIYLSCYLIQTTIILRRRIISSQ